MFRPRLLSILGVLMALAAATGCTPVTVTIRQFSSTPDAVRALRGHNVDAVYGDWPAMAYAARESAGTLEVVHRQFDTVNFGIAVNQEATALRAALTAALAASMSDEAYVRIISSWAMEVGRLDAPEGAPSTIPEASSVPQLEDGTLTVGMDTSFPPMGFRDETRELAGVDVELARELGRRLGVEVEFVSMDFDALLPAVVSGEIDAAMSAIAVTDERSARVAFVEYLRSGSAILVPDDNPADLEYPRQLCGRSVGVQEGTAQIAYLQDIDCNQ